MSPHDAPPGAVRETEDDRREPNPRIRKESPFHMPAKRFTAIPWMLAAIIFPAVLSCSDTGTGPSDGGGQTYSHTRSPGSSARDFLSDEEFTALTVEMDYVEGMKPTQEALDSLEVFLERRLHKPDGVTLIFDDEIPSPGPDTLYTTEEIRALEEEHRDTFTEGSTLAGYYLFMDGRYEDSNVLGVAYYNTSMAIFEKAIRDNTGSLGDPRTEVVEATSLRHEFGHILGLVANGTPMVGDEGGPDDHHDEAHGAHCTEEGTLMYYQVETTDFIGNLTSGGEVPQLEPLGIQDLQANGGK